MTLRPEVQAFAELMEERLAANDHKGGWKDCPEPYLYARLLEEVGEMLQPHSPDYEAADVANFAMMIWDNRRNRKESNP